MIRIKWGLSALIAALALVSIPNAANAFVECSGFPKTIAANTSTSPGFYYIDFNPLPAQACYIGTLGTAVSPATPNLRLQIANDANLHIGLNSNAGLSPGSGAFTLNGIPSTAVNLNYAQALVLNPTSFSGASVTYVLGTDPNVGNLHIQMSGLSWEGPGQPFTVGSVRIWGGPFGGAPPPRRFTLEGVTDHVLTAAPTWTAWLNRDGPGGSGDYDDLANFIVSHGVCAEPVDVECRRRSDQADWSTTGQDYTCNTSVGGVCRNDGQNCDDYEVRFLCH